MVYLIQPDEESDSENKISDQCDVIIFRTKLLMEMHLQSEKEKFTRMSEILSSNYNNSN